MGIVFYPRGGSAQVVRYLARALTERGHAVTVVSGSVKGAEAGSDARDFYSGLPLSARESTRTPPPAVWG